jgi:hypothetical protein
MGLRGQMHLKGSMFHLQSQDGVLRHCYPEMHKRVQAVPAPTKNTTILPPAPKAKVKSKVGQKFEQAWAEAKEEAERETLPEIDPFDSKV